MSKDFVDHCQARGLKVFLSDACEHLRTVPERSLSAVTAFHFVEHLPIDDVLEFLDLSVRALEPGGALILEDAEPRESHRWRIELLPRSQPYPTSSAAALLAFLVEARGLAEVETRFLHPSGDNKLRMPAATAAWSVDLAPVVDAVGARLFGPMDYTIIGRRI